eukprot:COSAG02_NODE_197_length_29578_cov_9.718647_1_plen_255_part_00
MWILGSVGVGGRAEGWRGLTGTVVSWCCEGGCGCRANRRTDVQADRQTAGLTRRASIARLTAARRLLIDAGHLLAKQLDWRALWVTELGFEGSPEGKLCGHRGFPWMRGDLEGGIGIGEASESSAPPPRRRRRCSLGSALRPTRQLVRADVTRGAMALAPTHPLTHARTHTLCESESAPAPAPAHRARFACPVAASSSLCLSSHAPRPCFQVQTWPMGAGASCGTTRVGHCPTCTCPNRRSTSRRARRRNTQCP